MNDELVAILLNLLSLCERNSNAVEQVLMLGVDAMSQPDKEARAKVLESVQITQNGCTNTLARIMSAAKQ